MACCIAWLNISVVMRLPPDEGPAAKDVPEPVLRVETGNNPDNSNSLYLTNVYLQYFMGILYLCMYRQHFSGYSLKMGVCPISCAGNINII
jgi:hypothetical protein